MGRSSASTKLTVASLAACRCALRRRDRQGRKLSLPPRCCAERVSVTLNYSFILRARRARGDACLRFHLGLEFTEIARSVALWHKVVGGLSITCRTHRSEQRRLSKVVSVTVKV